MKNPFNSPKFYREYILNSPLVTYDLSEYRGKSFMCVFFTRFCGMGCPFCFFKSAPPRSIITPADQFTEEGVDRFIQFCNQANLGYVLISGGGEPFTQKQAILRTIAEVKTERIVLVTSGSWAMNYKVMKKYIQEIIDVIEKREKPCKVTIRLSLSEGHSIKLGITPALNLIKYFSSYLCKYPLFRFQIHTFENDKMLEKVLSNFHEYALDYDTNRRASDDEYVIKIIPQKITVRLRSGYIFIVGVSKIFDSDLRPNLHDYKSVQRTIRIFEKDLEESEDNNSAVLYNVDGSKGFDWSLNYNGNICLWQNQVNDNQWNIYEDEYDTVLHKTFEDPITLSYIEKGQLYRENIITEASHRPVLRQKAISLRDYSGTILFEEKKIRLYYAIRVLQDYYQEGRINIAALEQLPKELKNLITQGKEEALSLYRNANYTIVNQYKEIPFNSIKWHDLLELINLGHYDLNDEEIEDALSYYNKHTTLKKYSSIQELETVQGEAIQRRLVERLMYMKPSSVVIAKGIKRCQLH